MKLDAARLHELRGWTVEAMTRLGVTIDGDRVVFPVRDDTGDLLSHERYQPDPARRNGDGDKMRAEAGATRELFPPPELIGDDEPVDGLLWLVEGHPDAMRLWSIGVPAVAVPGTSCWKDEWAARLARPSWRVVVCCDCDEVGRKLGVRVATALRANGIDARLLDLDVERDDGYDLSDFLAAATTPAMRAQAAELLRSIAAELPLYAPPSVDAKSLSHTWVALDLIALGSQPPEPPSISGLFYPGRRIVVSGEAEAGKSWLLQAVSVDEIRAERGVVWVDDDDMGPGAVLERLRSLGLSDEQITQWFAYLRPVEPISDAAVAHVVSLLRERNGRLLVLDAFNASLALHGYDPSSTPDVEQFFQRVVAPFCGEGAAVVLPDHVVKSEKTRGKYAYGSERKHTGVDVHLGLTSLQPFARGRTGKAKLTVHKDRPAFLKRPSPGLFVLTSDPDTGACSWSIDVEQDVTEEGAFRPTRLMEKVSVYLHLAREARTRTQIETEVEGKTAYVRTAIDVLVREGFAREETGPRGARLVTSERLFLESAEGDE